MKGLCHTLQGRRRERARRPCGVKIQLLGTKDPFYGAELQLSDREGRFHHVYDDLFDVERRPLRPDGRLCWPSRSLFAAHGDLRAVAGDPDAVMGNPFGEPRGLF